MTDAIIEIGIIIMRLTSRNEKMRTEQRSISIDVRYEAATTPWVDNFIRGARNFTARAKSMSSVLRLKFENGGILELTLHNLSYNTVRILYNQTQL